MKDFIRDFAVCPICQKEFSFDKVASTSIKVSSYDLDLKPEYRDINVSLYSLITCPNCNFTFQEKDKDYIYDYLNSQNAEEVQMFLNKINKLSLPEIDNSSSKSHEFYAVQLMLAANIYSILGLPSEVVKILIKFAWYYREQNEEEKELGILYYCGKIIEKNYETFSEEDYIFSLFYLGYINYRLNNRKEAANLFDYLLKNYNNPTNPYLKAAKFLRGELK